MKYTMDRCSWYIVFCSFVNKSLRERDYGKMGIFF